MGAQPAAWTATSGGMGRPASRSPLAVPTRTGPALTGATMRVTGPSACAAISRPSERQPHSAQGEAKVE